MRGSNLSIAVCAAAVCWLSPSSWNRCCYYTSRVHLTVHARFGGGRLETCRPMKPPEKPSGRSEERNSNALAAYPTERIRKDSPYAQFAPIFAARIKAVEEIERRLGNKS
jgi:hypothetical protein